MELGEHSALQQEERLWSGSCREQCSPKKQAEQQRNNSLQLGR